MKQLDFRVVPFGDVHFAWRPEGFYLFSLSDTYVDPKFLDYKDRFPQSESSNYILQSRRKANETIWPSISLLKITPLILTGLK